MSQFIRALKIGVGKQRTVLQEIEGLQVSFKIEQSNTAEPNAADISITNLSPSSIASLEEKSAEIFLNVGYTSAESLLFWGNDLDVETTKQGVDRVTQIKAKDGGKQLAESSANISIPRGTDLSQVVRKIVGTMENITLSQTELIRLLGIAPAKNGAIISASSREALTKVLSSLGYSWSIQNGEVKITKAGDIPPPSKIIELSAASGLLGTPSKTKTGIRFRALLNPKITPATPVSIISATLSGLYTVTKTVHAGNNRSGDWSTLAEGVAV